MGLRRRALLRAAGGGALAAGVSGVVAGSGGTDGYAPTGTVEIEGSAEVVVGDGGETAFVATGDGFATVDVSDPVSPRVLAERRGIAADRSGGPLTSILDVALDGDELLVSGPAQRGNLRGLLVFDVSDPTDPQRASAFAQTAFSIHNAEFADGYAYLTNNVSPDRPLTIYDTTATNDEGEREPQEVGRWSPLVYDADVEGWADLSLFPGVLHDVTVTGDVAYCAYWDGGTWMVDVSTPARPRYLGRVGDYSLSRLVELAADPSEFSRLYREAPGNDHYAATNEDGTLLAVGGEAWNDPDTEDGGPAGIDLYDVRDPAAATKLATIEPEDAADTTRAGTWVTAHNFELRGGKLYSAWYDAGVKVHDVSDPSNPELTAWWLRPDEARFWTAQVGIPGETFVATSYGIGGHRSALYVFPDRAGTQENRPSLTDPETATATATATETATATATATETATATPTETATARTTTDDPLPTPTETETAAEETPGFGALAALAGLGYGAYRYYRGEEE